MEEFERSLHNISLEDEDEEDIGFVQQAVIPRSYTTESRIFPSDSGSDGLAKVAYPISSIPDHSRGGGGGSGDDEDSDDDHHKRKEKKKSSDIDLDSTRGSDTIHVEMGSVAEDQQDDKCKVENNQSEEKPQSAAEDKPLAGTVPGLDQEDSIILRALKNYIFSRFLRIFLHSLHFLQNDVSSDLTHFKEGLDFFFKGKTCFARGGFGEVWHIIMDESVKDNFPSNCTHFVLKKTNCFTEDEKYIYAQKKIANHPNIVKTFLVVCKKEGNFTHRIIMERCGKSVDDYLQQLEKRGLQMKIDTAKLYWLQVVDAVELLHSENVIHMDITLDNILLSTDDMSRVKLADFGLAERLYEGCSGRDSTGTGTPYTAPEILDGLVYGRPADIYSLAVLFLQMLGYAPQDVDKLKDRDKDLGELIERCLDETPSNRPTAREIKKKLETWERGCSYKI